jgi:hypothetical protein
VNAATPRGALLAVALMAPLAAPAVSGAQAPTPRAVLARVPLGFQQNRGQVDGRARFVARADGYDLFLTRDAAVLGHEGRALLRLRLAGASGSAAPAGVHRLATRTTYVRGDGRGSLAVPSFAGVRYRGVYPGVDLVYRARGSRLEYDFRLAPHADPRAIRLAVGGARSLAVDGRGDLLLGTRGRTLRQGRPVAYQQIGGRRVGVAARYVVHGGEVRIALGRYAHSHPLVIDPTLAYSTFFGGEHSEQSLAIAVDAAGAVYITGHTDSLRFPTRRAADRTLGGGTCNDGFPCTDAFVTKLSKTGRSVAYSTYLGGSGGDAGRGIAVDASGSAYVVGATSSPDFPVKGAFDGSFGGPGTCDEIQCFGDAFVTKLGPAGALVYSTYLGGSDDDQGNAIAVDAAGDAFVAGSTLSTDFPALHAFQASNHGSGDAFVAKLAPDGASLLYSTFLGGAGNGNPRSGEDAANAVAVDPAGDAYVTGTTSSTDFPTMRPFQATCAGDCAEQRTDAFVTKLAPTGSKLVYSTYLGGWDFAGSFGSEIGNGIAVDPTGAAYVTGFTNSDNFPVTAGAFQAAFAGGDFGVGSDAFVTKLQPNGRRLAYSTYVGGMHDDEPLGLAVSNGEATITGFTDSEDFPTLHALQPALAGSFDAFVTRLNSTGSALVYSTFLGGGDGFDTGTGVASDAAGNAYATGYTGSTDFETVTPVQPRSGGEFDAYVAKITP